MKRPTVHVVAMVHLDAGHDRNGNPRRVFVAFHPSGDIAGAWDEGYRGTNAVPEALRPMAGRSIRLATSAAERRDTLRLMAERGAMVGARFVDAAAPLARRIERRAIPA